MRVILTRLAQTDLADIAEYIARDNHPRAVSFTEELRRRCGALASTATVFAFAEGYAARMIRKVTHKGYAIYYRIDGERVSVLRIVHGSRDVASLLPID